MGEGQEKVTEGEGPPSESTLPELLTQSSGPRRRKAAAIELFNRSKTENRRRARESRIFANRRHLQHPHGNTVWDMAAHFYPLDFIRVHARDSRAKSVFGLKPARQRFATGVPIGPGATRLLWKKRTGFRVSHPWERVGYWKNSRSFGSAA